jgi:ABC-type lipoprotein release transport system permease subunit
MSLIHFRYLKRKRTLALITILTLASALFSITAYSFLGFYNGFTNYVGQENNILAIYSTTGSTPFTGVVPLAAVNTIAALKGVTAVSPEVIAPCIINQQSIFIRGALPDQLSKLNTLTIIQGENIQANDTQSAAIGKGLADKLNLKIGDKILAQGVLSQKYAELTIKGIFTSNSALNDEAIVSIPVGQWLRGLTYNDATVIRTKIDPTQTNLNQLHQEITAKTNQTTNPSPTPKSETQQELETLIPITSSGLNLKNIGVEKSQEFMESYLNRYGISKDTLIILSIVVLVFASGTATAAITLFVRQHSTDIATIRAIGVTAKKVKMDLALRMIIWAAAATLIGTAISALVISEFQGLGYLQVLSHSIAFQLDPIIVAANFILLAALVCVNIARMELKQ